MCGLCLLAGVGIGAIEPEIGHVPLLAWAWSR